MIELAERWGVAAAHALPSHRISGNELDGSEGLIVSTPGKHEKAKRRAAREQRLQAALRENLKRRKAQSRIRGPAPTADAADSTGDLASDPGTRRNPED